MEKAEIIERLLQPGVIAIIRADSSDGLIETARALLAGGVTAMEVTMTTPNALEVIRSVRAELGDSILMGAGTVLEPQTCASALAAGAQFVVTPVVRANVIALCNREETPIVCGAYTPTEALDAHEAGADFIKIFPADALGPGYIRAIRAPLPQLRIIPTGGVDVHSVGEFIAAGCVAVAAGGSLVSKQILAARDWERLSEVARAFVDAVAIAREKLSATSS